MRPEVGAALHRCGACGGYEYGGAPGCVRCQELADGIVEAEWQRFWHVGEWAGESEAEVARLVVAEPDQHDWRVVDAAMDRLTCGDCANRLGSGPMGCATCDRAHGFRYAAVEIDRPGVPLGNEHAIRVNVSVVRRPQMTSANELLARRLLLPALLMGFLPTAAEAHRMSALIKNGAAAGRIVDLIDDWLRDCHS
ncbi:hypothetical protein MOQ72_20410 [Saccharopolyspora sp. K220]|uniref:hypothetical protein n=1 Tax=Saccharopolyspora soli TaxID=2926618 RepID=UPI001F566C32|nr:hypothetical protein [Saccharopolyspora soli]MCI2419812.1 hypothetical protein [Saccharopolyspora soli]